ncbi:MAG TPA: hypothetical protein ENI23_03880 [bacterium]|nr:hypothetical protein [bacterium]
MFEKILNKFGYITKKESLVLRQDRILLKDQVRKLEVLLEERSRGVLDINIGDPAPMGNSAARREYIARCAAFHKDVLDAKIKSMVSEVRGRPGRTLR